MHSSFDLPEELLEAIAKTLVNHPEEVKVRSVEGRTVTIQISRRTLAGP